jgi:hypothetical protein
MAEAVTIGWRRLDTATPVASLIPGPSAIYASDPDVAVERRRIEDPHALVAQSIRNARVLHHAFARWQCDRHRRAVAVHDSPSAHRPPRRRVVASTVSSLDALDPRTLSRAVRYCLDNHQENDNGQIRYRGAGAS